MQPRTEFEFECVYYDDPAMTGVRGLESERLYRILIYPHAKGSLLTVTEESYDILTANNPKKQTKDYIRWYLVM